MNNESNNNNETNKSNKSKKNRPITCKINENVPNNHQTIEVNPQSPKIQTNEFRYNSQPKLFSLLDIKDRFHSKATSLPNQFKRKIYSNINKLLYDKNNKEIFKIPQIDYDKINKKKKIMKSKSQDDIISNECRIQSAIISRKERLYKPSYWDSIEVNKMKNTKRDKLMPEGYEYYQKNIMNFSKNYFQNNYIKIKNSNANRTMYANHINKEVNHILIRKMNKMNQLKSDIFFLKEKQKEKEKEIEKKSKNEENKNEKTVENSISQRNKNLYKYMDSDIFNLRQDDPNIIGKSGEKSYFRKLNGVEENKNKSTYSINNETILGWRLRNGLPSLYNYTSSKYHLLNRNIKNIGKTKESVYDECKKLNYNFNPMHKQKSLCEFIDLSRVSAPNINNDYNKAISENPNVFKKKNEISSEYNDIFNHYNHLCDKPFKKFEVIDKEKIFDYLSKK